MPRSLIHSARRGMILLSAALLIFGCASSSSRSADGQPAQSTDDNTFDQNTVLAAAKGVFGDGAEGLAKMIEKAFSENGRPNAYIVGEEVGGGLLVALRYGDGTLFHKVEGQREVHWTGPSIGFEAGADGAKVFTLVYNLYDTTDVYRRFPAVEGQFYFIGGLGMNYLQRDNVKLAQIRLGVGLRATANLGYIKFSKSSTINPF